MGRFLGWPRSRTAVGATRTFTPPGLRGRYVDMTERSPEAASRRTIVVRVVLLLYALGSVAVAVPLVLDLTGAGELAGTTSGKILAAAVFSLGFGAAMRITIAVVQLAPGTSRLYR